MNWLKSIKRLLGRFWADLFADSNFLLGVEYLLSLYSKLTQNQYINWRNGLIAADLSVAQDNLPYVVLLEIPNNTISDVEREWYGWKKLWISESASKFVNHTYYADDPKSNYGWILYSKENIDCPDYLVDHMYGYTKILIRGLDYDFCDGRFLFYVDPAKLNIPFTKITDADGVLHIYYKFFGVSFKTHKVCDPVTGFESEWLNPCSDVAWDIHQNGATYYNTKLLLGKATGSVVCEAAGTIREIWKEQDYNCLSIDGKVYMSKDLPNAGIAVGAQVEAGTVLFGSLAMYKGTDDVSAAQVPGIRVMTDAGALTALNETTTPIQVRGAYVLPLIGDPVVVNEYRQICTKNISNDMCPYIQVGDYDIDTMTSTVNPYKFVTGRLRRGRSVTIRLVSNCLDYLAAAIKCLRRSSCAAGMVNIYVATEAETAPTYTGAMVQLLALSSSAPATFKAGDMYFNTETELIHVARVNHTGALPEATWDAGRPPVSMNIYLDLSNPDNCYRWTGTGMKLITKSEGARYSTLTTSVFSADAGMLAIAVDETLNIQTECAEARVLL